MTAPTRRKPQSWTSFARYWKVLFLFLLTVVGWQSYNLWIQIATTASSDDGGKFAVRDDGLAVQGNVCRGYNGVLHIQYGGDHGAAAATVFFIYMINQILYAERHNLLPWIYLGNNTHRVYDDEVHGKGLPRSFQVRKGVIPNQPPHEECRVTPASPLANQASLSSVRVTVSGSGMWTNYFEPVSSFDPIDNPCENDAKTPFFALDYDQVSDGIHICSEWAVRAWVYGDVPSPKQLGLTMREWYRPMRIQGADIVKRYFRLQPWLQKRVEETSPLEPGQTCLAMHIRTTDKALSGGRDNIELSEYLPYAQAYVNHYKTKGTKPNIYVATDSERMVRHIQKLWPKNNVENVRVQQNIVRSKSDEPTFDLVGGNHHRTNTEVLVDIYSMSKCSWFVHGRSAVSEAVMYLNPDLIDHGSIDLEDRHCVKVKEFKKKLRDND